MTNGTKRYLKIIKRLGFLYNYANEQLFNNKLVRPVITVQLDGKDRAYS